MSLRLTRLYVSLRDDRAPVHHLRANRQQTSGWNGRGRLTGVVDRDHESVDPPPNQPVPIGRWVLLKLLPEDITVRAGWSNTNGSVTFDYLMMGREYYAVSFGFPRPGSTDKYPMAAWDGLYPEPMP